MEGLTERGKQCLGALARINAAYDRIGGLTAGPDPLTARSQQAKEEIVKTLARLVEAAVALRMALEE